MSIISGRRHDLVNYPFLKISEKIRGDLLAQVQLIRPYLAEDIALMLIGLECFCQVYNQEFIAEKKYSTNNLRVIEYFCALVFDGKIVSRKPTGNLRSARSFFVVAQHLDYVANGGIVPHKNVESYAALKVVRQLPIDHAILEYWSGWPTTGAGGVTTYLALQEVYLHCGRGFTQKLYKIMNEFNSVRQRTLHTSWSIFLREVAILGQKNKLSDLNDPRLSLLFFRTLLLKYLSEAASAEDVVNYSTLAIEWRNHFSYFCHEYLFPSGLIALPADEFPMPRRERIPGSKTNIKVKNTGEKVKAKLITEVPLNVTDREAISILFHNIEDDTNLIRDWAIAVTSDLWRKVLRRKQQAKHGEIIPLRANEDKRFLSSEETKTKLRSLENPQYIANISATFEKHGYLTNDDIWLRTMFGNVQLAARDLGMPSIKSLLAYCALLILEHPSLTKSALVSHELFDKSGKLWGIKETDSGIDFISYKRRRGAALAESVVRLNSVTAPLVQQLIEVTNPLRDYLKKRGNDSWRYLFLTSGKSFAYPKRLRSDEISYRIELRNSFHSDLIDAGVDKETSFRLSNAFTLTRLRASAGVLEYLRTTSVSKMAHALGHKEYKKTLIDHYLPEPIRRFFEERWVRIFQVGIVCEAMQESEYLIQASGFSNMEEIDEFLRNHVISFPSMNEKNYSRKNTSGEIVFRLNESILSLLFKLANGDTTNMLKRGGLEGFWFLMAKKLIAYIDSDECNRPDIQRMLVKANPAVQGITQSSLVQ